MCTCTRQPGKDGIGDFFATVEGRRMSVCHEMILLSAVDGMNVRQDVVAIENFRGCQVSNLEPGRSTWNTIEIRADTGFAPVGTCGN